MKSETKSETESNTESNTKSNTKSNTRGRGLFQGRGGKVRLAIAALLALVGAAVLLYPTFDEALYKGEVAAQKREFFAQTEAQNQASLGGLPYPDLYRLLQAENEGLRLSGQSGLVDAFSYQTAGIDLSPYGLADGCIGYVLIPSIGVEMPIYLGANTENMRKGAVHLTQTSYPIGGIGTNAVIAAHRGGTREMFRNIHQVQIGDEVIIENPWGRLVYRAVEIRIILPTDIDQVKIQEGRDLVTLLSCNPLGQNYQRYALYCERAAGS